MRIFILVLSVFLLSSCSQVSLGYRFADWAIEDSVDEYLDLSSKQEDQLEEDLDKYFQWHATKMLPRYVLYLKQVRQSVVQKKWDPKHWKALNDSLEIIYYDTFEPFKKMLSVILVDLSEEQTVHLEKEIAKQNEEKEKEYGRSAEVMYKEQVDENTEMFEKWFGSISEMQKDQIREVTSNVKFPVEPWLDKRKKQQKELLVLLKNSERTQDDFQTYLENYLRQKPSAVTKLYYTELDQFRSSLRNYFISALRGLSEKQTGHFLERIDKLIKDFGKIEKRYKS